MLDPFMSDSDRAKLVGTLARFWVRWDTKERFGTITRVNPKTIWVGAYCYSHSDLLNLREWQA